MRFFLVIIFVAASGAGVHYSGVITKFQESTSSKKMRAVKPESIRNNAKESVAHKPVYTFFETLNDSTMTQYVDLKGKLMPTALAPDNAVSAPAKIKATPSTPPVEKIAKLEPVTKPESKQASKGPASLTPEINAQAGYVVQVSSFRDEKLADALKSRLQKSGFDAFLTHTKLADQGGTWHRVFLGRYVSEQKAQEAASLVRNKYKLNAVVRNTN